MPYDVFWFGDPQDYFVFQDAFAEKEKKRYEDFDCEAWQSAKYVMLAYRQVQAEVWSKRKNIDVFPKEPFCVTDRKQKEIKQKSKGHPLLEKFLEMRGRGKI